MVSRPTLGLARKGVPLDQHRVSEVERCMTLLVQEHGQGLCAEMAQRHLSAGGKRLRARLALASAAALGVEPSAAVPWSAACELLHNASLVHDDLQDGDRVRRDRPAIWTIYGADQAVNAGDLLLMLPTLAIAQLDAADALKWRLSVGLARHAASTARGQTEEMSLRSLVRLGLTDYLDAATGKTAGLFGLPVEGAAVLAGHSDEDARRLARPFEVLGLVFQMIDDVVDLYGEKGRGERGADVREGKVSALVVHHLQRCPDDRTWLTAVLAMERDHTPAEDVERVARRFVESGARDDVLAHVRTLAAEMDGSALEGEPALREVGRELRRLILSPLRGFLA